jgi:hypothetical protein
MPLPALAVCGPAYIGKYGCTMSTAAIHHVLSRHLMLLPTLAVCRPAFTGIATVEAALGTPGWHNLPSPHVMRVQLQRLLWK